MVPGARQLPGATFQLNLTGLDGLLESLGTEGARAKLAWLRSQGLWRTSRKIKLIEQSSIVKYLRSG